MIELIILIFILIIGFYFWDKQESKKNTESLNPFEKISNLEENMLSEHVKKFLNEKKDYEKK